MTKTIPATFDPKALPAWAQRDANVVELCKTDLAFRCDVCDAKAKQWQNVLKREAAARIYIKYNC